MKVLFFANTDWYLYNFRRSLISAVQSEGHEVVLVSPSGKYVEKLQQQGFSWQALNMERQSLNPLKELLVLFRLIQIYRKERPDVVHHFTLKCVMYGMVAALFSSAKVKINAITGLGYIFTAKSIKARILKPVVWLVMKFLLNNRYSKVIVQNSDDYTFLKKSGLVKDKALLLIRGSGVNTSLFSPEMKQKAKDSLTVLMATRLLIDKGVREYVAAAEQIKKNKQEVTFLLAGEPDSGNPSSITNGEVAEWKESGVVQLLGHVDQVGELLKTADIVVLPSYREGLPRILIEAAAFALPIVTTDAPGCREIVTHGENGYLVPIKNESQLVTYIETLIESPSLRENMGQAGRKKVEELLDERIVIEETIKTYQLA